MRGMYEHESPGWISYIVLGTIFDIIGMMARVITEAYLDSENLAPSFGLLASIVFVLGFHLFFLAAVPFAVFGFRRWPLFSFVVLMSWSGYGFAGAVLKS